MRCVAAPCGAVRHGAARRRTPHPVRKNLYTLLRVGACLQILYHAVQKKISVFPRVFYGEFSTKDILAYTHIITVYALVTFRLPSAWNRPIRLHVRWLRLLGRFIYDAASGFKKVGWNGCKKSVKSANATVLGQITTTAIKKGKEEQKAGNQHHPTYGSLQLFSRGCTCVCSG